MSIETKYKQSKNLAFSGYHFIEYKINLIKKTRVSSCLKIARECSILNYIK